MENIIYHIARAQELIKEQESTMNWLRNRGASAEELERVIRYASRVGGFAARVATMLRSMPRNEVATW